MPFDPIQEFIESRIAAGDFPSAVWAVGDENGVVTEGAAGFAVEGGDPLRASIDTIYDLASLTKPLVTGLLFAILFDSGQVCLEDRVSDRFEEFVTPDKRDITFEDLLAHRSGFEAWRPFYLEVVGEGRDERLKAIVQRIAELPLAAPRGSRVIYSDLNFILLGALIEKITGRRLDELANEFIFRPLGLESTCFLPSGSLPGRIAASETGNAYERKLSEEMGFETSTYDWRAEVIRGEVHDENCRFLGGVSGHAGVFSTARETLVLARQFLAETTKLLKHETCGIFAADITPGLDQARSAAFQLAATVDSSAHGVVPDSAFGHLGFTGTTLWIDPENLRFYILLTNRTHGRELPLADLSKVRNAFLRIASGIGA
ncbi:MAG TPA: serine hydrolase domain-containing protein [Aridibacter sp.]|nr:serine hydrolase domain-containing protein [Aridibacter sp.]